MKKRKLKMLGSRIQTLGTKLTPTSRWGQGRKRYAPGRDARRKRVFERDRYLCRACKEHGVLTALELHSPDRYAVGYVDHYVPLAQGGADEECNQWLLCKPCHDAKSAEDSRGTIREPRDMGFLDIGGIA